MIKHIRINNFRSHSHLKIDTDKTIVVWYGENGAGKTNILEAISMFSPGRGLRRARFEEMIGKKSGENFWNVTIVINDEEFSSGYIKTDKSGRRMFKISDKATRNLDEFSKNNYVLWMTYETDRLFVQSPSDRREFIDMFCNSRYPNHASNILKYEKLARERQKILKEYYEKNRSADLESWLDIVETNMASFGIEVAKDRIRMTEELEESQFKNDKFPAFKNRMTGSLEEKIGTVAFDDLFQTYKKELSSRRQKDFITKMTTFGPNRSDWEVLHINNNMEASLCSAGEQKMLLTGTFLSYILRNIKSDPRNLILLLDDVVAHLDLNHRNLLFQHIKDLVRICGEKISVWLSGTDKTIFEDFQDEALFINVQNLENL